MYFTLSFPSIERPNSSIWSQALTGRISLSPYAVHLLFQPFRRWNEIYNRNVRILVSVLTKESKRTDAWQMAVE